MVATAAGQGTEGESERGRFPALDAGALGEREPDILYLHTPEKHLEKALLLEAVTLPSPIFPITSACGARCCPETSPKGPSSSRRKRWPDIGGGPWPSHDASGADLGLARQDLTDAKAVTPEGRMAGALGGRVQ